MTVNLKGVGPLVSGPNVEKLSTFRSPGDEDGKIENALDIKSSSSSRSVITHLIQGGKLGALIDVRDHSLSMIVDRLDELAYALTTSVNQLHEQGYTARGEQGVQFFKQMNDKFRAAEFIDLSDEVKQNVNSIATAAAPDAPGDNRIALAISAIQQARIMNEGKASMDEYYNSIVTDVAVVASRNKNALNQQKDIKDQLNKMREQIAGVSIDEETTNLLQYQHAFDASAKVIQVADEMLKTVLDLKR
jgi:flagellar hook-associated protein 1 FlgK